MSTSFTSIFTNDTRAQSVHSLRAARGSGRHNSILDNVQSRASRRVVARREVTPFDFNIGRYHVSPFLRYYVVAARLIFNLRSLGLRKVSRIRRLKTYTSGRQKCGPKRGSKTSLGMTSSWRLVVSRGGSSTGWRPVRINVPFFDEGLRRR